MDGPDLDALVAQVRSGDREAFHPIFLHCYRPMRIALALRCRDPELVDEVIQEAFVAAYEHLDAYDPRGTFVPWIIGMARNRLARALRQRGRSGPLDAGVAELLAEPDPDLQAFADQGVLEHRLSGCLSGLGAAARQLAQWRFAERLEVGRIAERLGRSAASVSVSIHRVRQALRACLERQGAHG